MAGLWCFFDGDKAVNNIETWIKVFYKEYVDPDGISYLKNGNFKYNKPEFYESYQKVLNKRIDKFEVSFEFNSDIPGLQIKNLETNMTFCLKSDQFGFSVPSLQLNHPYDIYLMNCKNSELEGEIKSVMEWIKNTRIIGGSFFWPLEYSDGMYKLNPKYNLERGGTKYKRRGSYIEDRVDLTLYEIKEIIDSQICQESHEKGIEEKLKDNILFTRCFSDTMRNWLGQFKSFKEYVDFFGFAPFVDLESQRPYDIFSKNKEVLGEKIERKRCLYENVTNDQYKIIFDNIVDMVVERYKILFGDYDKKRFIGK